jgi:hypothetical protein
MFKSKKRQIYKKHKFLIASTKDSETSKKQDSRKIKNKIVTTLK